MYIWFGLVDKGKIVERVERVERGFDGIRERV